MWSRRVFHRHGALFQLRHGAIQLQTDLFSLERQPPMGRGRWTSSERIWVHMKNPAESPGETGGRRWKSGKANQLVSSSFFIGRRRGPPPFSMSCSHSENRASFREWHQKCSAVSYSTSLILFLRYPNNNLLSLNHPSKIWSTATEAIFSPFSLLANKASPSQLTLAGELKIFFSVSEPVLLTDTVFPTACVFRKSAQAGLDLFNSTVDQRARFGEGYFWKLSSKVL